MRIPIISEKQSARKGRKGHPAETNTVSSFTFVHAPPPPQPIAGQGERSTGKRGKEIEDSRPDAAPRTRVERIEPAAKTLLSGRLFITGDFGETAAAGVERHAVDASHRRSPRDLRFGLCQHDGFAGGAMRRELPQHFVPYGIIERARFGFGLRSAMLPTFGPFAASSAFMTAARIGLSCGGLLCHDGLRGSAEKRIGRRAVPAERLREPRQRHDQQQQGRIESQRDMAVMPEAAAD